MTAKQSTGITAPDGSQYVTLTDGAGNLGSTVSGTSSVTQSGTWTVQPGNTANTTAWLVKEIRSATGTKSNVASSASSVTVLASNANRLGMSVYNDSTQTLYLDLTGGTASSSSYSVQLTAGAFYTLDAKYTGLITGIWASANGNARVTEWT